jgi:hypothetical protein
MSFRQTLQRQLSGGWQAEKGGRIGFTDGLGPGKGAIDERKGLVGGGDLLAYHPKMGR